MSAILLTPPAAEPLSLVEAKLFLRVEHDDDDTLIGALIAGARIHVEAQTRRALITQGWRLTRDVWPAGGAVPVLPVPFRELLALRVYRTDGTAQEIDVESVTADTGAEPGIIAFAKGAMPAPGRPAGGIEFEISAGYGDDAADVPEPLRQAIRLFVAHWYENRAVISPGASATRIPDNVAALIAPYRVLSL